MTREEEVREFITKRIKAKDEGVKSIIRESAVLGMTWADEHPKNPWREGLPTEDGEYLVECGYFKCEEPHVYYKTLYWKHDEWVNKCLGDFVLRWMPIPKGGEK